MMQYLLAALTGLLAHLTLKIEVKGLDNVPRSGPLIVAANHIGWVDPPILRWILRRRIIYMAKIELFRWNIVGLVVRLFDAFPVRRGERDRVALRQSLRVLERGEVLGMFPEGTRSKALKLTPGHPGIALIALRSGAPVLPVGIIGTDRMFKWPDMILRNQRVVFNIGKPFTVARAETSHDEALQQIMLQIAGLLPQSMRGCYADDFERSSNGGQAGTPLGQSVAAEQ